MDDVVAVAVSRPKGGVVYFLTWGRIFDVVDPTSLESLVEEYAHVYGITQVSSVRVCPSLQAAADAPYFYEGVIHFAHKGIPFGTKTYPKWRATVEKEMLAGRHLYFCGDPKRMPAKTSKSARKSK